MTDKEIKERATKESLRYNTRYSEDFDLKKFLDNSDKGIQIDRLFHLLRGKAYRDGYIAGAKDNAPQWHYPARGELPEDDRLVVIYYKGGVADFGSYALGLNGWHNKFGDSISEPYMWIRINPPKEM